MSAPTAPRSNDPKGDLRRRWQSRPQSQPPRQPATSRPGGPPPQPRATTNLGALLRKAGVVPK